MKRSPSLVWRAVDGFANGAEVALQKLGAGVKGYINSDALLSPLWKAESAEVV
jgi:hypothetical protein